LQFREFEGQRALLVAELLAAIARLPVRLRRLPVLVLRASALWRQPAALLLLRLVRGAGGATAGGGCGERGGATGDRPLFHHLVQPQPPVSQKRGV